MDIYFDGVRLGALEEVNVNKLSKAEARGLYMDREDVVLDMAPEPEVEKVETVEIKPQSYAGGIRFGF
jgi:hypothetical protein